MDVVFYDSPGKRAVTILIQAALEKGLHRHGDRMAPYHHDVVSGKTNIDGSEVVIIFGISNEARDIVAECRLLNKPFVIIDKGYTRRKSLGDIEHNAYWRVSMNSLHPQFSSLERVSEERWRKLQVSLGKIREDRDGYILLIAPALRVFTFLGLGNLNTMSAFFYGVAAVIVSANGSRPMKFRGKSDSKMATTREGWQFAPEGFSSALGSTIEEDLADASLVVTHTTNAGVRAVMSGVPVLELGCGVVRSLAETCLDKISNPRKYTEEERWRFMCWLACQQWTLAEMASGEAWEHLRQKVL